MTMKLLRVLQPKPKKDVDAICVQKQITKVQICAQSVKNTVARNIWCKSANSVGNKIVYFYFILGANVQKLF